MNFHNESYKNMYLSVITQKSAIVLKPMDYFLFAFILSKLKNSID